MKNNLIDAYIEFKKKKLLECCNILYKSNDFLSAYIETYILTYYYHILGTLDYEDVKEYDYKVVKKELEGTFLELSLDNNSKEVKESYQAVLTSIIVDRVEFLTNNLNDIKNGLKELENKKLIPTITKIDELARMIKKYNIIENKFLNKLNSDNFNLKYNKYKNKDKLYNVEVEYEIKQLGRYKDKSTEKIFTSVDIVEEKTISLLNLLNIDVLNKMINQENIDYYFIHLSYKLMDLKKENIFSLASNNYFKQHVIFVINYNDYITHKQFVNKYNSFNFALSVDMSHINNVEQKLDSLDTLPFKYIILDKIKNKDYGYINNYDFRNKELIINEYGGE